VKKSHLRAMPQLQCYPPPNTCNHPCFNPDKKVNTGWPSYSGKVEGGFDLSGQLLYTEQPEPTDLPTGSYRDCIHYHHLWKMFTNNKSSTSNFSNLKEPRVKTPNKH